MALPPAIPDKEPSVAVLGAGSWGTALAYILAKAGHRVTLWDRNQAIVDEINQSCSNSRYLSGQVLPPGISATTNMAFAVSHPASIVVIAVPSGAIREVSRDLATSLTAPAIIISAAKGLEADSGMTMTEVIGTLISGDHCSGIVALSGPNLATEVVKGVPSVCIVAGKDHETACTAQDLFMSNTFRVYTHEDIRGVELAGALKNVLAIAAGVSEGLGFGDNTRAALMTRGLMEMTQIGVAAGAQPMTFLGIAGVGDLMATSSSRLSRNFRVGIGLAEGKSVSAILAELGQTAEGIPTSIAAYAIARRYHVTTPLFDAIHEVIHGGLSPRNAVSELMSRPPKDESAFKTVR